MTGDLVGAVVVDTQLGGRRGRIQSVDLDAMTVTVGWPGGHNTLRAADVAAGRYLVVLP